MRSPELALLFAFACGDPRAVAGAGKRRRPTPADAATTRAPAESSAHEAALLPAPSVSIEGGCRPANAPSFPSIAAVTGEAVVAFYDGAFTVVAPASGEGGSQIPRSSAQSAAPSAGPALAWGRDGSLLLTVEPGASGDGHRIVARRLARDLSPTGPPLEVAAAADPRYAPALVSFARRWVMGWIDTSTGSGRAVVRVLEPDGRATEPQHLLSPEASTAGGLALSSGPAGILAAWIDPRLGFSPIYAARGSPGGLFDDAVTVLPTGSVAGVPFVTVAAGPGDEGLIVWAHMGPLGQDYLSRAFFRVGGPSPRSAPLCRVDAYTTLRAAALRLADGWAILWDEPTTTGRWPPTVVRWQRIDQESATDPQTIGPGQGVAATLVGDRPVAAFRRGTSICVAALSTAREISDAGARRP